jgi:hypothetical protein
VDLTDLPGAMDDCAKRTLVRPNSRVPWCVSHRLATRCHPLHSCNLSRGPLAIFQNRGIQDDLRCLVDPVSPVCSRQVISLVMTVRSPVWLAEAGSVAGGCSRSGEIAGLFRGVVTEVGGLPGVLRGFPFAGECSARGSL